MNERTMCGGGLKRLGRLGAVVMLTALLTGCATPGGSETEAAICEAWRASFPSFSAQDTPETLKQAAAALDALEAACPE